MSDENPTPTNSPEPPDTDDDTGVVVTGYVPVPIIPAPPVPPRPGTDVPQDGAVQPVLSDAKPLAIAVYLTDEQNQPVLAGDQGGDDQRNRPVVVKYKVVATNDPTEEKEPFTVARGKQRIEPGEAGTVLLVTPKPHKARTSYDLVVWIQGNRRFARKFRFTLA